MYLNFPRLHQLDEMQFNAILQKYMYGPVMENIQWRKMSWQLYRNLVSSMLACD